MTSRALVRHVAAGLMTVGVFLGASAILSAAEVYTATLVEPRRLREPKVADVTLTIEQFSTEEDSARLQAIYEKEGSDGAIRAIREMNRGVATVKGGQTLQIHHVRVRPLQGGGSSVIVVTAEPFHFPGDRPDPRSVDALGIVQIDLNAQGAGRGSLAEVVAVELKQDGSLEIQSFNRSDIELQDVRLQDASDSNE